MSANVCVVIPVYNVGNKINKCVESLLFGKYKDINIILIDDCSEDDSWEYCVTLSNKFDRVTAIQNEKNSGVSFTRNKGIELSDSRYIVFVDSDDWVSENYLQELVDSIERHPGILTMCGICFIDEVNGNRRNYLWNSEEKEIIIKKEDYFSLVDNFFIQSPVNKIFELDIIRSNKLHFDIHQTMGEDFQFVLDYMQCLKSDYSVIINRSLYYYLRYSNTSLMGSFGLKEKNNEFKKRLEQLNNIIGKKTSKVCTAYKRSLKNTLGSYVYSICRNNSITDEEKISLIEYVMNDGKSLEYFKEQKKQIMKEKLFNKIVQLKTIRFKIIWKIINIKNRHIIKRNKSLLKNTDFSIISQNCIGGVLYSDLGLKFLSPTINLYFSANDFVKFALNLRYYLGLNLEMRWGEEYPIGILGDISVHFMHYETCSEAKEAWERRKLRINYNKILVLSTDMDGFDENTYSLWKQIHYPKILLSSKKWDDNCLFFNKYSQLPSVPDLIPKREFYKDDIIINKINML